MAKKDDGAELTNDDKFELLIQALMAQKDTGITADTLKDLLAGQATAMQKALKPENASHPGISAMSYPEGDRAKSREHIIPHEFFYNQFPVHKFPETHHWRELELAAKVEPGEFRVIRKDASDMTVTVTGDRDTRGHLTKVSVTFPISREEKWLVPPMSVVLYQLVSKDSPKKRFLQAMTEHLSMMMTEDEAVA